MVCVKTHASTWLRLSMCLYVCERERENAYVCVSLYVCVCVRVRMQVCVCGVYKNSCEHLVVCVI